MPCHPTPIASRSTLPLQGRVNRLHFEEPEAAVFVGDAVKQLAPIRALKGNGKFDVLEVRGAIYKAEYRMRFIYAQIPGSCVLMGQEILEASDPY